MHPTKIQRILYTHLILSRLWNRDSRRLPCLIVAGLLDELFDEPFDEPFNALLDESGALQAKLTRGKCA